jgi:hypothetical protein
VTNFIIVEPPMDSKGSSSSTVRSSTYRMVAWTGFHHLFGIATFPNGPASKASRSPCGPRPQ